MSEPTAAPGSYGRVLSRKPVAHHEGMVAFQNEARPKLSEMSLNNTFPLTLTENHLYPDQSPISHETFSPSQNLPYETFSPVRNPQYEAWSPSQNFSHENFSVSRNANVLNYGSGMESKVSRSRTQRMRIPRRPVYSETQIKTDPVFPQVQAKTEEPRKPVERQSTPPPVTFEEVSFPLRDRSPPRHQAYPYPSPRPPSITTTDSIHGPPSRFTERTDSISSYPNTSAVVLNTPVQNPDPVTLDDSDSDREPEDESFELQRAEFMVKRANELYGAKAWNQAEAFIQSLIGAMNGNFRLRGAKPGGLSKSHWLIMLVKVQASQQKWMDALNTTNLLSVTEMVEDAVPSTPGLIEFWQSYFSLKLGRSDKARSLCRKALKLRRGNPHFQEQHDHAVSLMRLIVGIQADNVEMEFYQSMLSKESYDNTVSRLIAEKDVDIILADIYFSNHERVIQPSLQKIDDIMCMEPFHQAIYRDNLAIVKHLTTYEHKPNTYITRLTPDGWSPLELAIEWASAEMVGYLFGVGALVQTTSSIPGREDLSTFHQACLGSVKYRAAKVKVIQERASPASYLGRVDLASNYDHHPTNTRRTPLMTLLAQENADEVLEIVKLLFPETQRGFVQPGFGIRARDTAGDTPLHYAARRPSFGKEVIQYLLDSGAGLSDFNTEGKIARDIALEAGWSIDVLELLKPPGGVFRTQSKVSGEPPNLRNLSRKLFGGKYKYHS
ncbi:hypothetical protein TWF694_006914 [Orbilia ellipsospora]|uniref:Ankyrin repeat protein n=1 Tax=Orbilia ellipsospora TaxID=2528407 RepID=A0AAV9XN43_9PEZI